MSPISKAACACFSKRNDLDLILATTQTLLYDQDASSAKLDEARGELEAAKEAFCATFNGLSKLQSRKTQGGRAYTVSFQADVAFLYPGFYDFMDDLFDAIVLKRQQEEQAEAERVRQVRQAEAERVCHEKAAVKKAAEE